MPLTEPRLSDPFRAVYLRDTALDDVPQEIMADYEFSRDFSILEDANSDVGWEGLASLRVQPTIFTLAPLHPDDDHLAFNAAIDQYKSILQRHMIGAQNCGIPGRSFKTSSGRTMLDRAEFDKWIPTELVFDLGPLIVRRGQQVETAFFTVEATWDVERRQRRRKPRATSGAASGASPAGQTDSD